MENPSRENDDKVTYFQEVTGVADVGLSTQILEAHGWDLDAAVSSMTEPTGSTDREPANEFPSENHVHHSWGSGVADLSGLSPSSRMGEDQREGFGPAGGRNQDSVQDYERFQSAEERIPLRDYDGYRDYDDDRDRMVRYAQPGPGIVWRVVTLPFSIIRGSYNLMYGAVGLGMWAAGGMLSYSLGALGLLAAGDRRQASRALLPVATGAAEASHFVTNFEREYGERHPVFESMSFIDALRKAGQQFKFLFVYLHSPDHANTPAFCEATLCSEAVVQFVNENFVVWGGDVRTSEGFQMSNTFKASTFPFCAVATASSNQRIALLQQVEGPRTASELLAILQRVVDEQGSVLVASRVEEEERQYNRRIREEQDAAYQAALREDQERERRRREEAERAAKEAEEVERKRLDEEEAAARAEREAAERVLALERRRQQKASSLGVEPEKGPDVTHVLLRLPNGERKDRRFYSHENIQKVYDYVDSLGFFDPGKYNLVSNFPRTVYGPDKLTSSLKDAGLHPQASLFVQLNDT
ncbi:unnamed protein product [Calypogeia fissa]